MTNAKQQIESAKKLGALAYANGTKCAPCLDKALLGMLVGRSIGETPEGQAPSVALFTAWTNAWMANNMAARVAA